jgi:hypothetical protein
MKRRESLLSINQESPMLPRLVYEHKWPKEKSIGIGVMRLAIASLPGLVERIN